MKYYALHMNSVVKFWIKVGREQSHCDNNSYNTKHKLYISLAATIIDSYIYTAASNSNISVDSSRQITYHLISLHTYGLKKMWYCSTVTFSTPIYNVCVY